MRNSAKKQQSQVQTIQRTVTKQRYKYKQILERQSLVFPSMPEDLLLFLTTGIKKTAVWKTTFVSEHQGRQNIGRAGEAVKTLRAMETYEKQKNRYHLCLLLFGKNVDLKNNKRICRKFVSIRCL